MAKQSAFQIFNQKLKEKIGVAEQVTTYPEEPELSTKLEVMTNQIKKITREIHKQEKTTSTLLEAGAELSDSLVDGGVSFREDPLRYMLAGSLDKVAEVQRHVDDLRSKLGKQIVSEVYEPLDNVIEVDVKEAKMQKSKFEKARVELDAGISKLNGLGKKAKEEKVKEVELEVDELRKNFSQVGMETVDKLQDTIALSEAEMLGSLVHYMELYRDFFVNSNRFMVTLIPEIEEYKNYIETQRDQLHGSAIAKQIEAAAAAAPPEKKFGTLRLKNLKSSFGIGDKKKVDKGTPASEIFAKPENDPFGKDIEQIANKDGSDVPAIVDKAVEYIENKGLQEEGIFRISASKKEVDQLKGEIAQTGHVNFAGILDPHAVVAILKAYLRELPEPLLTFKAYNKLYALHQLKELDDFINQSREIFKSLPKVNYATCARLFHLLSKVVENAEHNRMRAVPLSTVLTPNIFYTNDQEILTSGDDLFERNQMEVQLVAQWVLNASKIFN